MARAGRKRKLVPRLRCGRLKLAPPFPGLCAVYIIEIADGIVKIGRSENPVSRLQNLQISSVQPLVLICCFWMSPRDAMQLEKSFHRGMRKTAGHLHGELYRMDVGLAVSLLRAMVGPRVHKFEQINHRQEELTAEQIDRYTNLSS